MRGISELVRTVARPAARWTVNSHEAAIGNARTACTVLAQRRLEYAEVEEIVVRHERQLEARRASIALRPLQSTG